MSMAPLSLVKAVLAGSIALLAIPATVWFGHRLGKREFIGLGLSAIGLALLAVTMHNAATHAHAGYSVSTLAAFEGGAIAVGAILLFGGRSRSCATQGGMMLGASAGILVGVADISVKALTGTVPGDPMSLLGPWTLVALAGAVGGFFALARGLQVGGAIQVIALSTMFANVSAVLGGILVFGDPMGGDVLAIVAKVIAFGAVIGAAVLMPGPSAPAQRTPAPSALRATLLASERGRARSRLRGTSSSRSHSPQRVRSSQAAGPPGRGSSRAPTGGLRSSPSTGAISRSRR